jgi:GNAT superfamily N-acetyltransferase
MQQRSQQIMERVVVRPMNGDDSIVEITDLLHRSFAKGPTQPFGYPVIEQGQDIIREQIRRGKCWVAVLNGQFVGVGIVWPPEKIGRSSSCIRTFGAQLRQLAVEPSLWRRGIGSKVLDACEVGAMEMGALELWGSSPVGVRHFSFYKRKGYRVVEYVSWPGTDYQSVIFAKPLREDVKNNTLRHILLKIRYYLSFIMYKLGILEIENKLNRMRILQRRLFRGMVWIITKLLMRFRFSDSRDILLCCNTPLMTDYLGPFWEVFREDNRLKFYVVFLTPYAFKHSDSDLQYMRKQLPVSEVSTRWAYARAWDLVVCADHCFGNARRRSPAVYIGHGPKCKVIPGDVSEYAYGKNAFDRKGRLLYRRIFEERQTDRDRAIQENKVLRDAVVVVGNLENDRVLAQVGRRDEFRRQLGYVPEDVVVFILSTWGDRCLWNVIGDELLAEARNLREEFKFILSAHPHEYRPKPAGQRVWGEYLRLQRVYGFVVREPSESWIPYMIACDVVLSDYTGLIEYAALLEKPIVLTPVAEELIWKDSLTWKIRQFALILSDARMLRECLLKTKDGYPFEKLHELAQTIHPHPGEAAKRIRKEIYDLLGIPASFG